MCARCFRHVNTKFPPLFYIAPVFCRYSDRRFSRVCCFLRVRILIIKRVFDFGLFSTCSKQVILYWNRHGVAINRTTTTANRIAWYWTADGIGIGMMLDVILTIYTSFASTVSVPNRIDRIHCPNNIILSLDQFGVESIRLPDPLSCGSPDSLQNTTVSGRNFTNGANISYSCPVGHALIGNATRTCEYGIWSGKAPTCKCKFNRKLNGFLISNPNDLNAVFLCLGFFLFVFLLSFENANYISRCWLWRFAVAWAWCDHFARITNIVWRASNVYVSRKLHINWQRESNVRHRWMVG